MSTDSPNITETETVGVATCTAHDHLLGPLGREPVIGIDGEIYCRECAEFYGLLERER